MLINSQKRFFVWQFPTSTIIFLHFSWFNSYSKGDDSRLYSATDPFDYIRSIFFASERRCYTKVRELFWFCFLPVLKMIFLHNCQGDFHQSKMWQLVNSTRIFELIVLFFWTTVCDRQFICLKSSAQFSEHANLSSSTKVFVERFLFWVALCRQKIIIFYRLPNLVCLKTPEMLMVLSNLDNHFQFCP